MSNANFIVIQSNPNQKGGFVTKLQRKTVVVHPIFGEKTKSETYYISASKQIEVGRELPATILNEFTVRENEMVNPNTGETFMGKWLTLK